MSTTTVKFKLRRDTNANLGKVVLAEGEPGYATDTKVFKVGDGTTMWNKLPISTVTIGDDGTIPYSLIQQLGQKTVTTSSNLTFKNDILDPRPVISPPGQPAPPPVVLGGTLRVTGNIEANGDANETGSVSAKYLTLNDLTTDVETYVWNDQNTLLWQPFVIPGEQTPALDVLGWRSKLEQKDEITLLSDTATTSEIVGFLNGLVQKLSERGIIYRPPIIPSKTVVEFDVLTSMHRTLSDYKGIAKGKEHIQVLSSTPLIWGDVGLMKLTEISQIQSVELSFEADLYIKPYSPTYISDCRFMLSADSDSNCIFYAYATSLSENVPLSYRTVGEVKKQITDQTQLKSIFGNSDGTVNKDQGIFCNWYTGYSGTAITNCKVTKFVISFIQ